MNTSVAAVGLKLDQLDAGEKALWKAYDISGQLVGEGEFIGAGQGGSNAADQLFIANPSATFTRLSLSAASGSEYSILTSDVIVVLDNTQLNLSFSARVTDSDGDTVNSGTFNVVFYDLLDKGVGYSSVVAPITIDLNDDGVEYLSTSAGVTYDYNNDGVAEGTAWVSPEDGLLALSQEDGSLKIVFSTQQGETDLEGLAKIYDSNQDDVLDELDVFFDQFGVWQDADSTVS